MKKLLIALGLVFALLILSFSILAAVLGIRHITATTRKPSKPVVMHLDFSQQIVENHAMSPFQRFTGRSSITLLELIRAIDHAALNDNVQGMVADFSDISLGMAQAQEVRNAMDRFQKSGKWAIAYADTFFTSGTGTGVYYLASGFSEIYMHPTGTVGFLGLASEPVFIKNMLEKLGIVSYMDQRHEYKLVANMFNENRYTESHRESDAKLIHSIFDWMAKSVAASRDMTVEQVRSLVDRAPFFGEEALETRLVDGFKYWDQMEEYMEEKVGREIELVKPGTYIKQYVKTPPTKGEHVIGLVYGLGQVVRGRGSPGIMGGESMASKSLSDQFRQIRDDGDVDIVIFRVNSPGGSPDASATIDREIQLTRQAGIPVIVSMGDIAGSGGYYVAMSADVIMAQPLTVTGSIGVAGGKLVFEGLMEKLGVTSDETHVGEHALLFSLFRHPTESQHGRLKRMMDKIYEDFTQGVMAGRKLTPEQIDSVARGRIWTGADAQQVNLVDELGGLHEAMQKAREMLEVPEEKEIALRIYPRQKSFLEMITDPEGGFLTQAVDSVRSLVMLLNIVDSITGNDLKNLETILAGDSLTAPVSHHPFMVENR